MLATNSLYRELLAIRAAVARARPEVGSMPLPMDRQASASLRNLAHFVALQPCLSHQLQDTLSRHGLADLATAAPHVLATLDTMLALLAPSGAAATGASVPSPLVSADDARRLSAERALSLLGACPPECPTRVMVTAPVGADDEEAVLSAILAEGVAVLRINGSTAGPDGLRRTLSALDQARHRTGRDCRVLVDLTGRKVRTGPIAPAPPVVRLRPRRDALGRVVEYGRVWLVAQGAPVAPPRPVDAVVPVPAGWLSRLVAGNMIDFEDARGAKRSLTLLGAWPEGSLCAIEKSAYVTNGTLLHQRGSAPEELAAWAAVGGLAPGEGTIRLRSGDELVLTADEQPGQAAVVDAWGTVVRPAHIGCQPSEALDGVRPGQRVFLDDGKLAGVVERLTEVGAHVRITLARGDRVRLRAGRGIAFPDTEISLPALTEQDAALLPQIVAGADMVGLSFASGEEDIHDLRQRLSALGATGLGLVLKIETPSAVERLPELIAASLGGGPVGILIARGDLALMAGYEQLPRLQQQVLATARAAHVPVIWASQVLDQLARRGVPTRAEMTDLATAVATDCVMLNKGAHVVAAVRAVQAQARAMSQSASAPEQATTAQAQASAAH